ncbi:MAG: hypothetical protein HY377_01340 [Candidatus Blackburnbacteria bacterium]|nr:hypothetical protein [Candidatus Blackburnbacteria bacterium]
MTEVKDKPLVQNPPLISRRKLLAGGAVAAVVITAGVATKRIREMAEEATARKREALKSALKPGEEAYMLREVTIPGGNAGVNLRDKPSGPGTAKGDSANIIEKGEHRGKKLEKALVVRRDIVTVGKVTTDLWIAFWDTFRVRGTVKETVWFASVAAINNTRYAFDINSLVPGKLNIRKDANVELMTPDDQVTPIGLEPK